MPPFGELPSAELYGHDPVAGEDEVKAIHNPVQGLAGRTRRPLLRFALLGALVFCGELALRAFAPAAPPAALPGPGHVPGASGLHDAAWFREALRLGLHREDFIVQQRLARNMRFVNPDDTRSDAALAAEAIALGMHRSDLVVRRRLVQKMKLRIHEALRRTPPGEAELRAYWEQNAQRFMQPERVRISQLYFLDRSGAEAALAALKDAAKQGAAVRAAQRQGAVQAGAEQGGVQHTGDETGNPALRGDPLPLPRDLPLHARRELEQRFGPGFADAAFAAPLGRWVGPALSSYGFHLLFLHERHPAGLSDFESVRTALREALLFERGEAAVAEAARALAEKYAVPGVSGAAGSAVHDEAAGESAEPGAVGEAEESGAAGAAGSAVHDAAAAGEASE